MSSTGWTRRVGPTRIGGVLACLCAASPVAGGAAPDAAPKALVIGVDGFRTEALPVARTPNLDRLVHSGCSTDRAHVGPATVSGPGWSSMLTGVWMDKHGVEDNSFRGARYDAYPSFLARIEAARPELFTAAIVDWIPIDRYILGTTEIDFRFVHDYEDDGDARMVAAAVELMSTADPDVVFLYLADLDVAGHAHGFHPSVPEYVAELEEIDEQIGAVLRALHGRPRYAEEDWLVIVSSDHGGTIDGSHGRDVTTHRRIPLIVSGRAAHRGTLHDTANVVDVPVTVMTHLGVAIDPSWGLDGRPVGLARTTALGANLIFNGDAERSTGYDVGTANAGIAGWTDTGPMTVIRYGAPEGYPAVHGPGPEERGRSFFCGGEADECSIEQVVDVADLADPIDAGRIVHELSAWLGGYAGQRDLAWVTVEFIDADGGLLGGTTVGPVTLEDRRAAFGGAGEDLTGLLPRSARGPVPAGTRRLRITLLAETAVGLGDGYADELSLVLRER